MTNDLRAKTRKSLLTERSTQNMFSAFRASLNPGSPYMVNRSPTANRLSLQQGSASPSSRGAAEDVGLSGAILRAMSGGGEFLSLLFFFSPPPPPLPGLFSHRLYRE